MDHAAEFIKNLNTLLEPQFTVMKDSVTDLKDSVSTLQTTIEGLTKVVITATDDIKALKEAKDKHELKIEELDKATQENKDGVKDYKRTKAVCIAAASAVIGGIITLGTYGISQYYENKRHQEDLAYKQSIQESYAQLATLVAKLEKKVESK